MADLDFFWDPVCPWAWITSRWVREVVKEKGIEVDWRFIALKVVNEDKGYAPEVAERYLKTHGLGFGLLKVAAAVREAHGPAPIGALYEAFGTRIHIEKDAPSLRERAGIGTPVLTFGPPDGYSFFGPVIAKAPTGAEAVKLWDTVETLAAFPGFAELKRSIRNTPEVG